MGCLVSADADRETTSTANSKRRDSSQHHRSSRRGAEKSKLDARWWRKHNSGNEKLSASARSLGNAQLTPIGTTPPPPKRRHPASPSTGASERGVHDRLAEQESSLHAVPTPLTKTKPKRTIHPSMVHEEEGQSHTQKQQQHQSQERSERAPVAGVTTTLDFRPTSIVTPADGRKQSLPSQLGETPPVASAAAEATGSSNNPLERAPRSRQPRNERDIPGLLAQEVSHRLALAAANPLDAAGVAVESERKKASPMKSAPHKRKPATVPDDSFGSGSHDEETDGEELPVALLRDAFDMRSPLSAAHAASSPQEPPKSSRAGRRTSTSPSDIADQPSSSSGTVGSMSLSELVAQQLGSATGSSSHPAPAAAVVASTATRRRVSSVVLIPHHVDEGTVTLMTDLTFSKPRLQRDPAPLMPSSSLLMPGAGTTASRLSGVSDAVAAPATTGVQGRDPVLTVVNASEASTSSDASSRVALQRTGAQEILVQSLSLLEQSQRSSAAQSAMSDPRVLSSAMSNVSVSGVVPSDHWAMLSLLRERDVFKRMQAPSGSLARLDAVIVRCLRKWCVLWRITRGGNDEDAEAGNSTVAMESLHGSQPSVDRSLLQPEIRSSAAAPQVEHSATTLQPTALVELLRDLRSFITIRQDSKASLVYPDVLQDPLVHTLMNAVDRSARARALLDAYQESRRELLRLRGSMESDKYRHVPDEVLPGMFVGSYHAVMSPGLLSKLNICAVVSCVGNLFQNSEERSDEGVAVSATRKNECTQRIREERHWEEASYSRSISLRENPSSRDPVDEEGSDVPTFSVRNGVHYLFLEMRDKTSYRVDAHFESAIRFLRCRYFEHRDNILVLCGAGVSRAPTVMAAFLCDVFVLPVDLSLDIIRQSRPSIRPNEAFLLHLIRWYSPELLDTNS